MAKDSNKSSVVEALLGASVEDLQAIDATIAERQAKIDALLKEIDSLTTARKMIDIRINGKPARKPRKDKGQKAGTNVLAASPPEVAKAQPPAYDEQLGREVMGLLGSMGPMSLEEICGKLRKGPAVIGQLVNQCPGLVRDGALVRLTGR